jgi:hypothetical protein
MDKTFFAGVSIEQVELSTGVRIGPKDRRSDQLRRNKSNTPLPTPSRGERHCDLGGGENGYQGQNYQLSHLHSQRWPSPQDTDPGPRAVWHCQIERRRVVCAGRSSDRRGPAGFGNGRDSSGASLCTPAAEFAPSRKRASAANVKNVWMVSESLLGGRVLANLFAAARLGKGPAERCQEKGGHR